MDNIFQSISVAQYGYIFMIRIDLNHFPYLFCLYSFPIGLVHNLAQNFPGAELRPWSPTGVLQSFVKFEHTLPQAQDHALFTLIYN